MGSGCCCNGTKEANNRFSKTHMQHYQNYNKTIEQLDRYDRFYRIVCYPLHCIDIEKIYKILDDLFDKHG